MQEDQVKPTEEKEASQAKQGTADSTSMYVKVYAPYKVYFDGDAESISAASQTGPFDILPRHHNFITLLVACDIIVRTKTGEEKSVYRVGLCMLKQTVSLCSWM